MTAKHTNYTPWPESGCTLEEALKRTSISIHGLGADGASLHVLRKSLREHLAQGVLVATGAKGRLSETVSVIPSHPWTDMKVLRWDQAIAEERPKETIWYEIRVFPPLLAPNVRETVSGMTFRDAFQRFVLQDPEVRSLAKLVPKNDHHTKPVLDDGQFPYDNGSFEDRWPTIIDGYQELAKVINDYKFFVSKDISINANTQTCWTALLFRYRRLLQVCMQIGLRGTAASTGVTLDLNAAELSRPSSWLDVRNGDLLDKTPDGKFQLVLRALSFFHVKPTTSDELPSVTIKSHPTQKTSLARGEAREALYRECSAWLVNIMQASPDERAESKESLWQQAKVKWPALSERVFERSRDEAIRTTGATA